jgi:RNA polymerase sigma factor (sigma-70 family)
MEATNDPRWETLVAHATAGDRDALDQLVGAIQHRVYALALRMLGNPDDARDATQEILIRVVTRLGTYRSEAAFPTWVHRVASNYLLTARTRRAERPEMTFESLGAMIDAGLTAPDDHVIEADPAADALAGEIRLTCTEAMLLCLDAGHRLAFALGEILDLSSDEAAWVLEVTPDAYRQRLARARAAITEFMQKRCGVFSAKNPCRCSRQVPQAMRLGMLDPKRLQLVRHPVVEGSPEAELGDVLDVLDAAIIYRRQPRFAAPDGLARAIRETLARS